MKIVINTCHGGFGLSDRAMAEFAGEFEYARQIPRDNPKLIEIVERLGTEANGHCAELEIIEIPDGVDWQIEEYDGAEWVAEKHRTWGSWG